MYTPGQDMILTCKLYSFLRYTFVGPYTPEQRAVPYFRGTFWFANFEMIKNLRLSQSIYKYSVQILNEHSYHTLCSMILMNKT